MNYQCFDRGTEHCPCHLMEIRQCYTCGMTAKEKERCDCAESWKGICPYNEFIQRGRQRENFPAAREWKVRKRSDYEGQLTVIRLAVSKGMAQKCSRPGTYVMAETLGYQIPLSILRCRYDGGEDWIEIGIQKIGPKSTALLDERKKVWKLRGPFYGGLENTELLENSISQETKLSGQMTGRGESAGQPFLVAAKGIAAAPFLNIREKIEKKWHCEILLDSSKLPETFVEEYFGKSGFRKIKMEKEWENVAEMLERRSGKCMLLASPYYTEKILHTQPELRGQIVIANHANICCSVGVCGSCSHTDASGITVRKCKCTEWHTLHGERLSNHIGDME